MTETTTQPDPQVVAWMRRQRTKRPNVTDGELLLDAAIIGGFGAVPLAVRAASLAAVRKPLMVADIPAGQGAASLYLTRSDGELDLYYRHGDGIGDRILILDPHPALRDHLAATLPTIDTTEEH